MLMQPADVPSISTQWPCGMTMMQNNGWEITPSTPPHSGSNSPTTSTMSPHPEMIPNGQWVLSPCGNGVSPQPSGTTVPPSIPNLPVNSMGMEFLPYFQPEVQPKSFLIPIESEVPQQHQIPCYPLIVSVEGLTFHYQLTYDDVSKVFSRFGPVASVEVKANGNQATVQFLAHEHAMAAINELDSKQLSGLKGGTLRVAFMDSTQLQQYQESQLVQQQMAAAASHGVNLLQAPAMMATGTWPTIGAMGLNPWMPGYDGSLWNENNMGMGSSNGYFHQQTNEQYVKYTAKIEFDMENDIEFKVSAKIIAIARKIWKELPFFSQKNGKTRLRGRGSGYQEGPENKEADETLHLCISCKDKDLFEKAISMATDGINEVAKEYSLWRRTKGLPEQIYSCRVEAQTRGQTFADMQK